MTFEMDFNAAFLKRTLEAANRWELRSNVRESRNEAIAKGLPLKSDTAARLAERINILVDDVRKTMAPGNLPSNELVRALAVRPQPVLAEEVTNDFAKEAILAASNFLSVEFLERGVAAARSVGRLVYSDGGRIQGFATGFLVGPELLLTNHHAIPDADTASFCLLQMDYE